MTNKREKFMGMKILIFSGPTHEYIDPVRYIGNASSGKMGKALAETAMINGADVDFISGPVSGENLPKGKNLKVIHVKSAQEMLIQGRKYFSKAQVIFFCAAVADYAPLKISKEKISSGKNNLTIRLKSNPDIAQELCSHKKSTQKCIGFALESDNAETKALSKLKKKKFDAIILNSPLTIGAETGRFKCLSAGKDSFIDWGNISKTVCARRIFDDCF